MLGRRCRVNDDKPQMCRSLGGTRGPPPGWLQLLLSSGRRKGADPSGELKGRGFGNRSLECSPPNSEKDTRAPGGRCSPGRLRPSCPHWLSALCSRSLVRRPTEPHPFPPTPQNRKHPRPDSPLGQVKRSPRGPQVPAGAAGSDAAGTRPRPPPPPSRGRAVPSIWKPLSSHPGPSLPESQVRGKACLSPLHLPVLQLTCSLLIHLCPLCPFISQPHCCSRVPNFKDWVSLLSVSGSSSRGHIFSRLSEALMITSWAFLFLKKKVV